MSKANVVEKASKGKVGRTPLWRNYILVMVGRSEAGVTAKDLAEKAMKDERFKCTEVTAKASVGFYLKKLLDTRKLRKNEDGIISLGSKVSKTEMAEITGEGSAA